MPFFGASEFIGLLKCYKFKFHNYNNRIHRKLFSKYYLLGSL